MASRKMNLRKTSEKATSRITYKYFSVLVGYLLAIPLCPIGFTTISHIKQYQALKAQNKAMQEAKDKAKDEPEQKAEAETETEAKADAATQSPAKAETAAPANSEAEVQAQAQADTQADNTLQSSQDNVVPDAIIQATTTNSSEAQK